MVLSGRKDFVGQVSFEPGMEEQVIEDGSCDVSVST